jgi:bifunctional DNA-binding transcriptional regulator/antitoxin component of YhaV-PrlF toxin-antitoxin module
MSQIVEVSMDDQGCIRIPAVVQDRLGLSPGMRLIIEEGEREKSVCAFPKPLRCSLKRMAYW